MNVTKILLIALISSVSALLTLWLAAGLTTSGWYIPIGILLVAISITNQIGLGSISDFLKLK